MEEGLRKTSRIGYRETTYDWGPGQSGEKNPIRAPILFPLVRALPKNPVKPSVLMHIKTGAIFTPDYQNTADLHLIKSPLMVIKLR